VGTAGTWALLALASFTVSAADARLVLLLLGFHFELSGLWLWLPGQAEPRPGSPDALWVRAAPIDADRKGESSMLRTSKTAAATFFLLLLRSRAVAVEPVKYIGVYVLPYYESAPAPDGRPQVAVHGKYDVLLASNTPQGIVSVRDRILREPKLVTPMTLMVLAIRLYDVGLRDDSVFWFYVAKDRHATLADVLDLGTPALSGVDEATRNFVVLAGPTFNGYAFCNIKKQKELRLKALDWVEKNPYEALFLPQLPAKPGDRQANLRAALEQARERLRKEQEYLDQPENLAKLASAREENHAGERYCW
jgi:hypothetical protein